MKPTEKQIRTFQNMIFIWWKKNKRDLPWRHTHDPYKIAVSEIMLQQTQVTRVIPVYSAFINKFPNVKSLSKATPGDVLRFWKGMGYNRRALYLQKLALQIVYDFKGVFPETETELTQLSGVGTYTARAILIFAYRKNTYTVDVNINKIVTHFFYQDVIQRPKTINNTAELLVPKGKSWEWHQALMDYGAIELPKLNIQKTRKITKIPFKQTERFFRGKIIDELRLRNIRETVLKNRFENKYNITQGHLNKLLSALQEDGLISIKKNGTISLPE